MELIKNYIIGQVAANKLSQDKAKKMLLELKGRPQKENGDIAVIGMSCRFPQANNPEEYWNNLINGVNSIRDLPQQRKKDFLSVISNEIIRKMLVNKDLDEEDIKNERITFAKSGCLDEVDKFDAGFFQILPGEAKFIDPIQRVFLESAWEAIEDAGYGGKKIYGTKTGVYVGRDNISNSNYKTFTEQDQRHLTGSWPGILATRISYIFNLRGPGIVIDTACSSGAVAIHEACSALRNKECEYALAAGIQVHLQFNVEGEDTNMTMVESKDSVVRTFDKDSNGTVWGEGVGVLLLKPLSKAIEDGDHIHAIIKGSAINNDGASNGITAPNAQAQEAVIVDAWKNAKVNPETISYIEAHATGTILGDPIEIKGIANAFRRFTGRRQFCGIGSLKPNIGHLVGASGLASVIKIIMALKNEKIPAVMNFQYPNPNINFCDSPVYINDSIREWKRTEMPRRAGVSSFGFSGTNCHIVLEEPPVSESVEIKETDNTKIFTISAKKKSILKDYINRYAWYFSKPVNYNLRDICFTANTGRGHFACRIAMVVRDVKDLKEKIHILKDFGLDNINEPDIFYGYHKVVRGNRRALSRHEITEEQKGKLSLDAVELLTNAVESGENDERVLSELCRYYVAGAEVEWDTFYSHSPFKRVPLPVYPLERVRLWANPREFILDDLINRKITDKSEHPLFDDNGFDSIDGTIFTTWFEVSRHWVLSDHKVMGNFVVPGTTYLEMAREAGTRFFKDSGIILKNVVFITPLVVNEGEVKEVQTVIRRNDTYLDFIVASKLEEGDWTRHAEGRITEGSFREPLPQLDIHEIKSRCTKELNGEYKRNGKNSFDFGARWNNIRNIYIGNNEMIGYFELPAEFSEDLEEYGLHPALMDSAINMVITGIGDGLYLPWTYRQLKIYRPLPGKIYSHLRKLSTEEENPESVSFDVTLADENGVVFAEVEDYTIKRVHNAAGTFRKISGRGSMYHEIIWIEEKLESKVKEVFGETILLFKGMEYATGKLIATLENKGARVIEIEFGDKYKKINKNSFMITGDEEDYEKLISEVTRVNKIIHITNVYGTEGADTLESLGNRKKTGIWSVFYLARVLANRKFIEKLDLILIADYAAQVNGTEENIYPHNAAFLGIGKVIGIEQPYIICRCLDIDGDTKAEHIFSEIASESNNHMAAYRKGKRYVQRFQELDIEVKMPLNPGMRSEGIYMITGGTGGIGLKIGKHFAAQGIVSLCLVNRSEFPKREDWAEILGKNEDEKLCRKIEAIRDIESEGTNVICCSADVTSYEEMEALIGRLKEKYGRINGIVHAAGVAGNSFIINRSESEFRSVIEPKIDGTWIMDKLTADDDMDFTVLLSSITAIVGGPGQGDYTAANSYMDSFAYLRNKRGNRTVVINWPVWKETGMAADFGVIDDGIFKAISTEEALEALDQILQMDVTRVIASELNYKHSIFRNISQLPFNFSREILSSAKRFAEKSEDMKSVKEKIEIKVVTLKGRDAEVYTETEKRIGRIWGTLLGMEEINIHDDFYVLGGNSLLSVKLEAEMEKINLAVEYQDITDYPTIFKLADYLERKYNTENDIVKDIYMDIGGNNSDISNQSNAKAEVHSLKTGSVAVPGYKKILEDVVPFNELIYRGCFYSALFPAVRYFGRPVVSYLVNEINIYRNTLETRNGKLDIKYYLRKPLNLISGDLGIRMNSKLSSDHLIEDIKSSIIANRLVIVCVDSFYESLRIDTYMKTHWPHCLLVYGFDEKKRIFDILEHRHAGSLIFERQTISYLDMSNSYKGYLENFSNVDVTEIAFRSISVHEGKVFPTYFELCEVKDMEYKSLQAYYETYAQNMIKTKTELYKGLKYLKEYSRQFEAVALDEGLLKDSAQSILDMLSYVIGAKHSEKYRYTRLDMNKQEIEDILDKSLDCWNYVRTKIARFLYTSDYKKDAVISSIEKLKLACQLEFQYYERLYNLLENGIRDSSAY